MSIFASLLLFVVIVLTVIGFILPLISVLCAIATGIAGEGKLFLIWLSLALVSGTILIYCVTNNINPISKVEAWCAKPAPITLENK